MAGNNTVNYYNNNVRNAQFSAQRPDYSGGQPQLAQQAMEGAQDTYVAQRAENIETDWMTIPATAVAWYGICKGTDYFNNKLMSKEYAETPFAKLGQFGDKVTEGYNNSWFRNTKVGNFLHNARVKTKGFIKGRIDKNPVLSSIRDNPAIPEWKMPNIESRGLLGKHSIDVEQLIKGFMDEPGTIDRLERVGYTKDEIKGFKAHMKTLKRSERSAFIQQKELDKLREIGCDVSGGIKNARAQALGFADAKQVERVLTNLDDHAKEIMESLGKSKKGICFVQEAGEGFLGFIRKPLFKRTVTTKEIFNKYKLVLNEGAAKSKLGRALTKGGAWFMEGATNRFAGGKMVALMQAVFIAQAFTAAMTKGENVPDKIKTFIERNNELISYIFAAPIAVGLIFHTAGMKYAGMTKEEVKAYREAIKNFNTDVEKGLFTGNKQAYKDAIKNIENMRFKDNKFFTRMFQKLGGLLNVGNEQFAYYRAKKGTLNLNILRKCRHWFRKGPISFAVRGLIGMMVLMPLVTKTTTKISNAIFGKPKHSLLDEEKEEAAAAEAQRQQEMQAQLEALQQDAAARQQAGIDYEQQIANNPAVAGNDLLDQYRNPQNVQPQQNIENIPQYQPEVNVQPQQVVENIPQETAEEITPEPKRTYIPSSEGVKIQPEHTYVPSSDGVKLNAPDYSAAEQALAKSASIENEVMRVLSMK